MNLIQKRILIGGVAAFCLGLLIVPRSRQYTFLNRRYADLEYSPIFLAGDGTIDWPVLLLPLIVVCIVTATALFLTRSR